MNIRQPSNDGLRGWHLAVLAGGTFTLGMDGFVLPGLLPEIARSLSVPVAVAGQLTTIFAVTYAIGSPVIATLTGRWDRRVLLGGGLALFLLGMVAQALGASFAVVVGGRVLAALGAAAFQANAYAVAGVLAVPARRGRALAAVTAGTSLSTVLGVPFGVLVGQLVGWRGAMWVIAALALVVAAVIPALPGVRIPPTSMRTRLGVLIRPQAIAVLSGTVLFLVPFFLLSAYLPLLVGDAAATGRLVVFALLAVGLGQIIGNRIVGGLVDDRGPRPVLLISRIGMTAVCATLIPLHLWYPGLLVLLLALGLFSGLTVTPQQHRLFTLLPEVATIALGLNGSAIYLGAAIGALEGGVVVATGGAGWLPIAATVMAAAGIGALRAGAPERSTPDTAQEPVR
ncbi:MAG TPA: MFS transporter [Pseudonocardiaceae bacterium]|nr:MFS transporter [Pseudonocardiaceae bacterium]